MATCVGERTSKRARRGMRMSRFAPPDKNKNRKTRPNDLSRSRGKCDACGLSHSLIDATQNANVIQELRIVEYRPSLRASCATLAAVLALAASNATLAADGSAIPSAPSFESASPPASTEPHQSTAERNRHAIKFDNSHGTAKLTFQENLFQRQCIAVVMPDFVTVAPGEIAEVALDVKDSVVSGCKGESKHAVWNITSIQSDGRASSYMLLFSIEPERETQGRARIAVNARFSRPGMPYAATCGTDACLDEWAPAGSRTTVFFYPTS